MNDARLAESTVSIVINVYTGILQGIPNLLDILTESKESSYYHNILLNDIAFTKNAVTISANDISARALEIKLQEKGSPFDKVPSTLLEDHVKANGRHVFLPGNLITNASLRPYRKSKLNYPLKIMMTNWISKMKRNWNVLALAKVLAMKVVKKRFWIQRMKNRKRI